MSKLLYAFPNNGLEKGDVLKIVGLQLNSFPPIEINCATVVKEYPYYLLVVDKKGVRYGINKYDLLTGEIKIQKVAE